MISRVEINSAPFDCKNLGDIEITYSQSSETACFQAIKSIDTELIFVGSDFETIVFITSNICQQNILTIYESCDGVESVSFEGFFTRTNCTINYDTCSVAISLEDNSDYQCFIKTWQNEINILQTPVNPINNGTIEYPFFRNLEYVTTLPGTPVPSGYGAIGQFNENALDPNDPDYVVTVSARVIAVTGCLGGLPQVPDADPSWYLVDNDCANSGTATFARPAISNVDTAFFNLAISGSTVVYTPGNTGVAAPPPVGMNQPILLGFNFIDLGIINDYNLAIGTYTFYIEQTSLFGSNPIEVDNGRQLVDVIQYMLDQQGCGLTFESRFYGTSGFENDPNPVTGLTNNPMSGLMVFQKSDVADPSASENATIANISISTMLQDLNIMHNVWWQIDEANNKLIIEHWSTLNNIGVGIDLLNDPYLTYAKNNQTVSYNKAEIPNKEEFSYAVPSSSVDFNGLGITYNVSCAGASAVKLQTQQICTDWSQVLGVSEFETEGLMLVQPESLDPSGAKAENGRITGVFIPNAPLGFGATLPDYYTYNRPSSEGEINNTVTVFDSTKRLRNIKEISIPYCCSISDANILVNTFAGEALIQEATYIPSKQILTIKPILEI